MSDEFDAEFAKLVEKHLNNLKLLEEAILKAARAIEAAIAALQIDPRDMYHESISPVIMACSASAEKMNNGTQNPVLAMQAALCAAHRLAIGSKKAVNIAKGIEDTDENGNIPV